MNSDKDHNNEEDKKLVRLTLQNKDFFAVIVGRYEEKLFRYIRRITNVSNEELYDILQDVFVSAYRNLNSYDSELKFSSWIYRIAHNQTISNHRKNKSRPHGNAIDIDDEILKNITDGFDITKEVELNFLKKDIYKILDKLNDNYREILILRFFEGKDYREISDILKRPEGTVATQINRAKEQFKKEVTNQNNKLIS